MESRPQSDKLQQTKHANAIDRPGSILSHQQADSAIYAKNLLGHGMGGNVVAIFLLICASGELRSRKYCNSL